MISWAVLKNNSPIFWRERDDREDRLVYFSGVAQTWKAARKSIRDMLPIVLKEQNMNDSNLKASFLEKDIEEAEIRIENGKINFYQMANGKWMNHELRPNVIIGLVNDLKQILLGRRIRFPETWQFPQGGIDKGETVSEAGYRELGEELGLEDPKSKTKFMDVLKTPCSLEYFFPEKLIENEERGDKYIGQSQHMALFQFLGKDSDIDLRRIDEEFSEYQWISIFELRDKWHKGDFDVPIFKSKVYSILFSSLEDYFKIPQIDLNRANDYPELDEPDKVDYLNSSNISDLKDHGIL